MNFDGANLAMADWFTQTNFAKRRFFSKPIKPEKWRAITGDTKPLHTYYAVEFLQTI